ncbi:Crp/Fnr family transcriptional regulator [Clostridium fungisolvens]|uniref:Crp/Fnr family transcriptional regulator n=1 Tax=Clostridium fungisolvens TaxID=1604897 RepID=A0A6V8SIM2_9CLOT|nr:Crp/Fnr family transcriptional regulator [Clostridium fungisolvens]GFP76422.1 hypothetical protein bsdtw1_02524 [Clostridium fungisolvens]
MECQHCSESEEKHEKSCIENVPIFSTLTFDEVLEVSMTTMHREYKKGESIYLEGDVGEKLFIINKGKVKIVKLSETGREKIIRVLGPGEFMGELSLFTQNPFKNNAEALESTTVCIVDGKKINDLIEKRPRIALKIIKEMSSRLEEAEDQIQSLAINDVEQRLADTLLEMAESSDLINLTISKKDLASHIGMSQETLSRKLASFQKNGWIDQEGQRKIIILDKNALRNIRTVNNDYGKKRN